MSAISHQAPPKGVIVSISPVPNFDQKSNAEAVQILYEQLIPACEAKGVNLSGYGNHCGIGTLKNVSEYTQEKADQALFDIKKVQQAFTLIPKMIKPVSTYEIRSYGFKHAVERLLPNPQNDRYITNGDTIAAMLLHGYPARFGRKNDHMEVNAEFKANYTKEAKSKLKSTGLNV